MDPCMVEHRQSKHNQSTWFSELKFKISAFCFEIICFLHLCKKKYSSGFLAGKSEVQKLFLETKKFLL